MSGEYAIEPKNTTKRFGKVTASDKVYLSVKRGEILFVLDKDGSGKTVLINMISGIYYPDEGQVFAGGKEVTIRSSKDSFALGIGIIHQHFKLVDVLTVAENIILGLSGREILDMKTAFAKINEPTTKYGSELDPDQKIYTMSISQKRTVGIVKLLYRGADILILNESTAALTSQKAGKLLAVLRNMHEVGHSIIIITHELHEVLALSDRVSVLHKGQYISMVYTADVAGESLIEMMVGKKISLDIGRPDPVNQERHLVVEGVTCVSKGEVTTLDYVSFTAYSGEILGIADIAESDQREFLESIAGFQPVVDGTIIYYPPEGDEKQLSGMNALAINRLGAKLSSVSGDRLNIELVGAMDMTDNMMLRGYHRGRSVSTNRETSKSLAEQVIEELEIVTPGVTTPMRRLSGSNVQRVPVEGEISSNPKMLMMTHPVCELDINSSYTIYHLLNERKKQGAAVTCVDEDLDTPLELYNRTLMLCAEQVNGVVDGKTMAKEQVGLVVIRTEDGLNE